MKKNTIITMVAGQAATGRSVEGLIAENKVKDNKRYSVTKFDAEAGEITFTEILADDVPEGTVADVIKINAENAETMRYIMNPNEKPVPEASIEEVNGKKVLVVGGNQISLGTIDALRVVGGVKGEVVIAVPGDEDGLVNLMKYEVQLDKFSDLMDGMSKDIQMVNIADTAFIINNVIIDVPQVDEDGNPILDENGDQVIRQRCIGNKVLQYNGAVIGSLGTGVTDDDDYDYDYDDEDYEDEEEEEMNLAPIESIRIVEQGNRKDLVVVVTKDVDSEGYLVDADEPSIMLYAFNGGYVGSRVGTFYVKDAAAKVYLGGSFKRSPVVTVKDEGKILIRDRYGLKVIDDAAVVDAMEGYNAFLGTEVTKDDEDRDVVKFIYGNKDMKVKAFTMVNTDRGILYEVCD